MFFFSLQFMEATLLGQHGPHVQLHAEEVLKHVIVPAPTLLHNTVVTLVQVLQLKLKLVIPRIVQVSMQKTIIFIPIRYIIG